MKAAHNAAQKRGEKKIIINSVKSGTQLAHAISLTFFLSYFAFQPICVQPELVPLLLRLLKLRFQLLDLLLQAHNHTAHC